ncbi:MAG: ABC transporter substrate-binding protein [Patescibacteria group bacterium]
MPLPSFIERVRGAFRRIFFWLPSASTGNEEVHPEALHDHALVMSVVGPQRIPRWRQVRYVMRVLSRGEQRIFILSFGVALVALGVAGASFASTRIVTVPVVGGTFTEAVVGEPKTINPVDALSNDVDRDLVHLIYSGLFRDDGLNPVPDLTNDYQWSPDGKTLTVNMRKDAHFHDGAAVTSADVKFTIDAIQDTQRKSPLAPLFQGVTVSTPDDSTVVFTLSQPDPQFLSKLTVGILPAHLWQDVPAQNASLADLNLKPVGSGPYRVKSFSRDSVGNIHSFTLERDDNYYRDKPFIQTLVFQFFPDQTSALDALKADLVDGVAFVNGVDALNAAASARVHDLQLELPQETVAFFNVKDKTIDSKEVRQALSFATNRDDLVTALHGAAVPVSGPYPFDVTSTMFDLDKARQLLDDAGWVLPQNGNVRIFVTPSTKTTTKKSTTATSTPAVAPIETSSSTEFSLTITVPNEPDLLEAANALARDWSLVGAKVSIDAQATDDVMQHATRDRDLQVVLINVLLDPNQDLFPFWWSGEATDRGLNISGLSDSSIDAALTATQNASTTDALLAARQSVTNALTPFTPAVFLVRPYAHELVTSKLKGTTSPMTIATPADRFDDLGQWYLKTGWRWK